MPTDFFNIKQVLYTVDKQLQRNSYMRKQANVLGAMSLFWPQDTAINLSGQPISKEQQEAYQKNKEERERYAPYAPKPRAIYIAPNNYLSGMHLPGNVNLYVNYPTKDTYKDGTPHIREMGDYKNTIDHEHGHDATWLDGAIPLALPYTDTLNGTENAPDKQMDRRSGITRYSMEEPSTMQEVASKVLDKPFSGISADYNIFNRNPYMYYATAGDSGPFGPGELTKDKFIDYTLPRDPNYKPSKWDLVKHYAKGGLTGMLAGAALGAGFSGAKDLRRKQFNGKRMLLSAGIGALGGGLLGLLGSHMAKKEPMLSPNISQTTTTTAADPVESMRSVVNSLDLPEEAKKEMLDKYVKEQPNTLPASAIMDPRLSKIEMWVNSAPNPEEYARRYSIAVMAKRGMNVVKDKDGTLVPTPQGVAQAISQQRDPKTREQYNALRTKLFNRLAQYKTNPRYLNIMRRWHLSPSGDSLTGTNLPSLTIEHMQNILKEFDAEDRYSDLDNSTGVNGAEYNTRKLTNGAYPDIDFMA